MNEKNAESNIVIHTRTAGGPYAVRPCRTARRGDDFIYSEATDKLNLALLKLTQGKTRQSTVLSYLDHEKTACNFVTKISKKI